MLKRFIGWALLLFSAVLPGATIEIAYHDPVILYITVLALVSIGVATLGFYLLEPEEQCK